MSRRAAITRGIAATVCAALSGMIVITAAPADTPALTQTLKRVSEKVRDYYDRAQTILATETVRFQPVRADLQPDGYARQLVYELRVEWSTPDNPDATPEPNVIRKLLTVNGKEPQAADEPECADPRAVTPEPLFMLLPEHRRDFLFSLGQPQRMNGRTTNRLDYISLPVGTTTPTWDHDCVSIPLEGRTRGSIYIDNETDAVLRLEEHLIGLVDVQAPREYERRNGQRWMYLERADFTVRYSPVVFKDPDETLTLPASMDSLRVFRGASVSRIRITQSYANYRRFLTGGHLITPDF